MENSNFYFSIIAEAIGLILLVLLGFIFLLKRDKNNLSNYILFLKQKIKTLKEKIKHLSDTDNQVIDLLTDTRDHIKNIYQQNYAQEIENSEIKISEDNSKDHFITILGHQTLSAAVAAIDNSNTAEQTWSKISSQLSALVENYRVIPETKFESIISEKVSAEIEKFQEQESSTLDQESSAIKQESSTKDKESDSSSSQASSTNTSQDQFIEERKSEIDRLKSQISSQFENIWELQNQLSTKVTGSVDPEINNLTDSIKAISQQLKDAQLCINMMEADILTSDEEVADLKEQLEKAMAKASIQPPSHNELVEDINKKDALIARFSQESKEMLTLIDGMEAQSNEQSKRINELEGG